MKGQDVTIKRGLPEGITEAFTDQAIKLAKAIGISIERAAKMLDSFVFQSGDEPKTPEETRARAKEAADAVVTMSKRADMAPEDVEESTKFAFSSGHAVGLSSQYMGAQFMTLKRAGVPGSEAGVAVRGEAAHIGAPTSGGYDAAIAAGTPLSNYYAKGSQPLTSETLDQGFFRRYGKHLSKAAKAKWDEKVAEEGPNGEPIGAEKMATREGLDDAMQDVLDEDPSLKLKDRQDAMKEAHRLQDLQRGKIDAERFARDFNSKANYQQLVAFYGPKIAARIQTLRDHNADMAENEKYMQEGVGRTDIIAENRNQGYGAEADRLAAKKDAAELQIGEDVAPAAVPAMKAGNYLLDKFNNMPGWGQLSTVGAGLGAGGTASYFASKYAVKAAGKLAGNIIKSATSQVEGASAAVEDDHAALIEKTFRKTNAAEAPAAEAPAAATGAAGEAGGILSKIFNSPIMKGIGEAAGVAAGPLDAWALGKQTESILDDARHLYGDFTGNPTNRIKKGENFWGFGGEPDVDSDTAKPKAEENAAAAQDKSAAAEVHGTVDGQATINSNIVVEPSQWFVTKIGKIEEAILKLSGSIGQSPTGAGMPGSQGTTPIYTGGPSGPM